jgi:hypothetical protein
MSDDNLKGFVGQSVLAIGVTSGILRSDLIFLAEMALS